MDNIQTFYADANLELLAQYELQDHRQPIEDIFLEEKCQFLVDQDVIQDYHLVKYTNEELNIRLDAWGFRKNIESVDENEGTLVLILQDFRDSETLLTQTKTEFRQFLSKGVRFYKSCLDDDFRNMLFSEGSPAFQLADYIKSHHTTFYDVLIIGLTNTDVKAKSSLVINETSTSSIVFRFDIWDISRFFKIEQSASGREDVDIDFVNDYEIPEGLPVLPATLDCDYISSYLFVISGDLLANIYDQWNERLLEQNPRTFLQFSTKVNKGIRNTINNEPEKFFSYNNGLSAVADAVKLNQEGDRLLSIHNFQIVNGGQTTAAIYTTKKLGERNRKEVNLCRISVMVKLTVVKKDYAEMVIPHISEYSNTQNKVSPSAFSVNHPDHKQIEKLSRNILTPSKPNVTETKWFYERVQGQYKNQINLKKTDSEKRKFEEVYPKSQKFTHKDMAKYIMAFDCRPYIVCRGAEKCYAEFCSKYLKIDEDGFAVGNNNLDEQYFKQLCAKAIIFKGLEKKQFYGIKFVAVPYIISFIVNKLKESNLQIDFEKVWNDQFGDYTNNLLSAMNKVGEELIPKLLSSMKPEMRLPSEWAKKDACWEYLKNADISIDEIKRFATSEQKVSTKKKKDDVLISVLNYVCEKGSSYWINLYNWCSKRPDLFTDKNLAILNTATNLTKRFPTDKQANIIVLIEKRAIENGYFPMTYKVH